MYQIVCTENKQSSKSHFMHSKQDGGGGIHSFLSYGAEMVGGVHTGQVKQRAVVIFSRDVLSAAFLFCGSVVCSRAEWG